MRVLARARARPSGAMAVILTDEIGVDCTEEFAEVAQAVAAAALAEDAILDGYLTVEATQEAVGVMPDGPKPPTQAQIMSQAFVAPAPRIGRRRSRRLDPDRPIAFVAVDLLRIDGTALVDLPLLERKRLLEGALPDRRSGPGDALRSAARGQLRRRPWFAQGFRELAYKAGQQPLPAGRPQRRLVDRPMPAAS